MRPLPERERLPDEREAVTQKFRIHGEFGAHKLYVRVGLYPDGRPGEVFVTMDKFGSTTQGFAHAWCKMVSVALQRGVPLVEIVEKFKGMRFEPSGRVEPASYGTAWSVPSLIVRFLERRFGGGGGDQEVEGR